MPERLEYEVLQKARYINTLTFTFTFTICRGQMMIHCRYEHHTMGAVVQLVEYRTSNQEVAGSTHTRSTASNLEQVANLLCVQANAASYPQRG